MSDVRMGQDNFLYIPPGKQAELMHPNVLAYIGDTVYDLYIRQMLIQRTNHRLQHLHKEASKYVSARAQAEALKDLMVELTEEEKEVVRRGRNAKSASSAKNAGVLEYRHSTALECLIGFLYYKQQYTRLHELFSKITLDKPMEGI